MKLKSKRFFEALERYKGNLSQGGYRIGNQSCSIVSPFGEI
ncbi:hypothetical protein NXW60_20340 [Bacteroides fragilis]|nr:hypothetical protein NXW60_20340 [Bacteroides fragilis]